MKRDACWNGGMYSIEIMGGNAMKTKWFIIYDIYETIQEAQCV